MARSGERSRSRATRKSSTTTRSSSRSYLGSSRYRSGSTRKSSRSLSKKKASSLSSTKRQELEVTKRRHKSPKMAKNSPSEKGKHSFSEFSAVCKRWSEKRKFEERSFDTAEKVAEELAFKPKETIGLVSLDCPGFHCPNTDYGSNIDRQELTRILIDIRRKVQHPNLRAKVERDLGDPSLFVVPRDERQPLSGRVEFLGKTKAWQEVTVVASPIEEWEEKLIGSLNEAGLKERGSEMMSHRPQFRGEEHGWQKMVVVAKPIKEWEVKVEESLKRKVEVVVVMKPIKKWDDKLFYSRSEERSLGRRTGFRTGRTKFARDKSHDKKSRRRRKG